MEKYDLLIRGARVVDPGNGVDGRFDIGIAGEKIVEVGPDLSPMRAGRVLEAEGQIAVPGLIDLHVHASAWLGGSPAHRMLARAGVTTALDVAGPIGGVLELARSDGAGISIACLEQLKPGDQIESPDAPARDIERAIGRALDQGAIGVKILGGHYPLTPRATADAIRLANRAFAWVAFHCGTTETGSDMTGFREAFALAAGHRLHIAHVNSYTRGLTPGAADAVEEAREALRLLAGARNIVSESYLAVINGSPGRCVDGVPESRGTRRWLELGGYPATRAGLERAVFDGWAKVSVNEGGEMVLRWGAAGVEALNAFGTELIVCFAVNPPVPRLLLATAKRSDGSFIVDAIATDGGGIPRNVIAEWGMALVRLEALSLADLVRKASLLPARLLGLRDKGHLGPGADADVALIDPDGGRVTGTIALGRPVFWRGVVIGHGTRVLTTERGAAAVRAAGLTPRVIHLAESGFYRRAGA